MYLQHRNAELRDRALTLNSNSSSINQEADPFDFVLSLEEHFVEQGKAEGLARGREMGLEMGRDLG